MLFELEPHRPKPASHAGALMRHKSTDLVALVDPNEKNRMRAARLFPQAALYRSAAECLKNHLPHIVTIATPATVRAPLIRLCLKYGAKMVICEKPLAGNSREAEKIKKLVDSSSAIFVLNYQRRFSRLFARVRSDIRKKKLGRIQQVTCYYSNGLHNNGGHIVDALLYLLPDPIVSVASFANRRNATHLPGDINVDGILRTKKETVITLQSLDQRLYAIYDIKILGEKGAITLTAFGERGIWESRRQSPYVGIKSLSAFRAKKYTEPLSATKGALEEAIRCYEDGRAPRSGVESGCQVLRILDALRKSAAGNGARVRI